MACRLKLDFHAGADIFSTSFTMSFADYCLLRDCPVTNPRPRCERDVTVAGAVLEILRREPDVFVRTAPDWLGEWLRKFLRDDLCGNQILDAPRHRRDVVPVIDLLDGV